MTDNEDAQKELQRKYFQLQLLKQYATSMVEEKGKLEAKITEMAITANAIVNMKDSNEGHDIMASIGSELYINADMKKAKTFVVGVGSGAYVRKPAKEAEEIITSRRKEYEDVHEKMSAEIMELAQQIEILERQMQEEASKA